MKIFRRITILALTLALICAFGVSAFAASSYSHAEEFMGGDHIVYVSASIDQISTRAFNELPYVVAFESSTLNIDCIYDYKDHSNVPHSSVDGESAFNSYSCSFIASTSDDPLHIKEFTKAVYVFDTTFTAYGGTFNYNPASVTVTPSAGL